jgi:hypothetical protein
MNIYQLRLEHRRLPGPGYRPGSFMTETQALVELHVWPAAFNLPSIDPSCLAAVLYLQLVIPGRYLLFESTTPDNSPSGGSVPPLFDLLLLTGIERTIPHICRTITLHCS